MDSFTRAVLSLTPATQDELILAIMENRRVLKKTPKAAPPPVAECTWRLLYLLCIWLAWVVWSALCTLAASGKLLGLMWSIAKTTVVLAMRMIVKVYKLSRAS